MPENLTNYQINQWKKNFKELVDKMLAFGFVEDELKAIYRILAAIILLCDVKFESIVDRAPNEITIISDEKPLIRACELLGVDFQDLTAALISISLNSASGQKLVPRNLEEAKSNRDRLAEALYSRIFGWIVKRLNDNLSIYSKVPLAKQNQQEAFRIGVLDISGFENLKQNSLEQLLINTTNEELQNTFQRHVYDYDQEFYQREGLTYPRLSYKSNRKIVDLLLQKPIGILSVLRDESKSPYSDDATFVSKLNEYFGYSTEYVPSREHSLQFGVKHFCGDVKYNGHDFLRKNRDILSRNIISCLQESTDNFVEDLFFNLPTPTGSFSK